MRGGGGGERVILRVTNCTHADRVRVADALESPCRCSRARNCRPRRRRRDDRGGTGPSSRSTPRRFINFSTGKGKLIRYKNPRLECPGENYTSSSHSSTIAPTVLAAILRHTLSSSSLTPGLRWKLAPILVQSVAEVTVLLHLTRGRSAPRHGVPPNRSLIPRNCCPGIELLALSTGLDKSMADVPVPSPDPDVSGVWVGNDRGPKDLNTPTDLATRPSAVRPGRSR